MSKKSGRVGGLGECGWLGVGVWVSVSVSEYQHLLLLGAMVVPTVRRLALVMRVLWSGGSKLREERGRHHRSDVAHPRVFQAVPDRAQSLWVSKVCHLQGQVICGALNRYAGGL